MRILEIGPSITRSRGGMATVINGIKDSEILNKQFDIKIHESYIDGSNVKRGLFSIYAYLHFLLIYKKFDIFHIHMASYGSTFRKGYYIRFLKKRGKRIILHIHGAEYIVFYNKLSPQKKKIVNDIWEKADVIIALSEEWKKAFCRLFNHQNIIIVHNGIDASQFKGAYCNVEEYRNNFLLLGRLGKRKGAYDIIKAVKKLKEKYPEIRVYMAGDGEIAEIKNQITRAGLNNQINVEGWIDFDEKINLMNKVATILLPSYNEGLPMTILEGMSAGKIIISTDVGGIPEVITNDINGILIKPGNIDSLASAMAQVVRDVDFAQKCSRNNINKIEQLYSLSLMHNKIAHIFSLLAEDEKSNDIKSCNKIGI